MSSEDLRKFNRRESLKLKIIGYSFLAFVPVVISVVVYLKKMEGDITSPLVSELSAKDAKVILCSNIELDIVEVKKAFEGLYTSKGSGSHPTERVSMKVNEIERLIGRDSLRNDLIWVMPENNNKLELLVGGYVRSNYISRFIGECTNENS